MDDVFELAYRYVVPSIRNALARELVKKRMSRKNAAKLLNLSRSAVSRYLSDERGVFVKITRFKDVQNMVEKLAYDIVRTGMDEYTVQEEVSKMAAYFLSRKYFCTKHKELNPNIDVARCRICKNVFQSEWKPIADL
jgi:predicted transcriptional regulator